MIAPHAPQVELTVDPMSDWDAPWFLPLADVAP